MFFSVEFERGFYKLGKQGIRLVRTRCKLGMELYAPRMLPLHAVGGAGHLVGRGDYVETGGHRCDGVAMAHPHLRAGGYAGEKRVGAVDLLKQRAAIFACGRRLHGAAVAVGHELGAVAYAQHRQAPANLRQVGLEGFLVVDRER